MPEELNWGIIIAVYLFLGGMSAAAYYVGVIADWVSGGRYKDMARLGSYTVLIAMGIGLLMLIVDLGRPLRFWHLIFQTGPINNGLIFKAGSVMSLGVWIITAFVIICGVLYPAMWLAEERFGRNLPIISAFAGKEALRRKVGIIGLPLALLVAVYTGVLLGATSQPVWADTPLLPMLFVLSATSTGFAVILLLMSLGQNRDHNSIMRLEKGDSFIIKLELVFVALLFVLLLFMPESSGIIRNVMFGSYAVFFWLGVIVAGLLLPLTIQRYSLKHSGHTTKGLAVMASLLVLCGGFFLRYVILLAV